MKFRFKTYLLELFNIKLDEGNRTLLLFLYSFFMGLFVAYYFVPANSVFIQQFGIEELPFAYLVAGIVGYGSSFLYSKLQTKISSRVLFTTTSIFMLLITLFSRLGIYFIDNEKYLKFWVFLWGWPFISLVGIQTGALAIKLLNLVQVKRLFGLINLGGVVAAIFSYLTMPFFVAHLSHQYDLLLISLFGIFGGMIILNIIHKQFSEKPQSSSHKAESEISITKTPISKQRYFWLMLITATFSMLAIYLCDFGFLATIKLQTHLFQNAAQISHFLALVYGGLKVGELLISLLSGRLLSLYGVKFGLVVLPFTILILTFLAWISGFYVGVTSLAFFIILILTKCLERILRRGLDDPAVNVLYHAVEDEKEKLAMQSQVGNVMQLSIALAGVVLLGGYFLLKTPQGIDMRYFPVFFLPFVVVWLIMAMQLHNGYKDKIRKILADKELFNVRIIDKDCFSSEVLIRYLLGENIAASKMAVVILSETNSNYLEPYAELLLQYNNDVISKAVLRNIDALYPSSMVQTLEMAREMTQDKNLIEIIDKSIKIIDRSIVENLEAEQIYSLAKSENVDDKLTVLKFLEANKIENDEEIIVNFLNDSERIVKYSAIKLAVLRESDFLDEKIFNFIEDEYYKREIIDLFIQRGKKIIPNLDLYFAKQMSPSILLLIIEIFAKMKIPESNKYLLSHINYPNREVQIAVINALYFAQFRANEKERNIIKQKIVSLVENIVWNWLCIFDLTAEKNTLKLVQALDIAQEENFETLFLLLSFVYQPELIELVKTNIVGQNTIFALEIIENFMDRDFKKLLVPLFDKLSLNQRIKKLKSYFKVHRMSYEERLRDIVLKDYKFVDHWTHSKAIEIYARMNKLKKNDDEVRIRKVEDYIGGESWTTDTAERILHIIKKTEIPDEIYVCLHHPEELIYSAAAQVIFEDTPFRCIQYLEMLSSEKQDLILVLETPNDEKGILTERIKMLKKLFLFFSAPENSLIAVAKQIFKRNLKDGEKINFDEKDKDNIILVLKGTLILQQPNNKSIRYQKNDILIRGLNVPIEVQEVVAQRETQIIYANRKKYFNAIVSDVKIVERMISGIMNL